jgi:hypothetical protein
MEAPSAWMMEVCHSILNPASSFSLHFCSFKRISVHNKTNNGIVFHVDYQKSNCFKSLPVRNKTSDGIVFPMDHQIKCFKSLLIRNKTNDGIIFLVDHQKIV